MGTLLVVLGALAALVVLCLVLLFLNGFLKMRKVRNRKVEIVDGPGTVLSANKMGNSTLISAKLDNGGVIATSVGFLRLNCQPEAGDRVWIQGVMLEDSIDMIPIRIFPHQEGYKSDLEVIVDAAIVMSICETSGVYAVTFGKSLLHKLSGLHDMKPHSDRYQGKGLKKGRLAELIVAIYDNGHSFVEFKPL